MSDRDDRCPLCGTLNGYQPLLGGIGSFECIKLGCKNYSVKQFEAYHGVHHDEESTDPGFPPPPPAGAFTHEEGVDESIAEFLQSLYVDLKAGSVFRP